MGERFGFGAWVRREDGESAATYVPWKRYEAERQAADCEEVKRSEAGRSMYNMILGSSFGGLAFFRFSSVFFFSAKVCYGGLLLQWQSWLARASMNRLDTPRTDDWKTTYCSASIASYLVYPQLTACASIPLTASRSVLVLILEHVNVL